MMERIAMRKKLTFVLCILPILGLLVLLFVFLNSHSIAILDPAGIIAQKQRNLLVWATMLSMLVIIPVYIMTIFIIWKYRASNTSKKVKYQPDWANNRALETIWWGIPCVIIVIMAVVAWNSSHDLDPYKPITSGYQPVTVQVVALDWKWLFIYPEQRIASVNFVQFPKDTPVNFQITADAPMNSLWIPRLGGQVYAMSGMTTKLHLMADRTGDFAGSSANISGEGYAGMTFTARASTQDEFFDWVQTAKRSTNTLSPQTYETLARPSKYNAVETFVTTDDSVYDTVISKYMPAHTSLDMTGQEISHHD